MKKVNKTHDLKFYLQFRSKQTTTATALRTVLPAAVLSDRFNVLHNFDACFTRKRTQNHGKFLV